MRIVVVSSVVLLLAIVLELALQDPLQESSVGVSLWLNRLQAGSFVQGFRLIEASVALVATGVSEWIYLAFNKKVGLLAFIGIHLGGGLISALKILISHPRPFWVYPEMQPADCPTDYASPSEQCLTAGVCIIILFWCWMKGSGVTTFKVALLASALLILLVYQVHLRLQFYFQVVLSLVLSLWLAAVLMTHRVYKFLKSAQCCLNPLYTVLLSLLSLTVCSAMLYLFYEPSWDPKWEGMHLSLCGNPLDQRAVMIEATYKTTKFFTLAGFFLGQYWFRRKYRRPVDLSGWQRTVAGLLVIGLLVYEQFVVPLLEQISWHFVSLLLVGGARAVHGVALAYVCPWILSQLNTSTVQGYKRLEDAHSCT